MISEAGRWSSVIALVDPSPDGAVSTHAAAVTRLAGWTVRYSRSWRAAFGSLVFGLYFSLVIAMLPFMALAEVGVLSQANGEWLTLPAAAALFGVFFLRPGMNRDAAERLRAALAPERAGGSVP